MQENISLKTLASGAVEERFNDALVEVLKNIVDPNTEFKTKRKIVLTVTFSPVESRDFAAINCDAKMTLAPQKTVTTGLFIGIDQKGVAVAAEMLKQAPGQLFVDEKNKVVDLKKSNTK